MLEIAQLNSLYCRNLAVIKMRFAVVWKLISCFLTLVLPLRPYSLIDLTVTSLLSILKPAMRFLSTAHKALLVNSWLSSPELFPPFLAVALLAQPYSATQMQHGYFVLLSRL